MNGRCPATHSDSPLPPVTIVRRASASARALEAHLCDARVAFTGLAGLEVEQLLTIDTRVAVVFVSDFLLSGWLAALSTLHSRRPDLVLVCVAGHAEQSPLWRAFEGSSLPPLVLRDPAPAPLVYEALRIAHDTWVAEGLDRSFEQLAPTGQQARALAELSSMLGAPGQFHDHAFDRLLPMRLRAASDRFWTPLEVVQRATLWLEELGVRSVVDIGSGVGKFCVAGALLSSCSFIGIEQRQRLVIVARNLARLLAVDQRVSIVGGRFGEVETPVADCYYLFNPFEENLFSAGEALDDQVELSRERFRADLRSFRALVAALPVGAYVLTYNGVGGRMPDYLDEVRVDRTLPAVLRLLRKVSGSGVPT
jgi:SAM-dependent methyltransferase